MDTLTKPHVNISQKMGSSGDGGSMANYQINLGEDLTINATLKTFEN
jgi:hypothetical protein